MSERTVRSFASHHAPPNVSPSLADRFRTAGRRGEADRIVELLEAGPNDRLLDVGGRTGAFTARFTGSVHDVTVLDPDPEAVRQGGRRHPSFRFVNGSGLKIPFPDGAFGRITAIRSTHHMGSPERFLAEAYRSLAAAGRIVIEERPPGSVMAKVFRVLVGHRHGHALDFRTSAQWGAGLSRVGFIDVRATAHRRWYFVTGFKAAIDPNRASAGGANPQEAPAPSVPT
ncbi:MAG: class I SAM-dependent methyltransferase [Thermoplasmata archaeon]|nr:class I SAM-dependent methyltransferase [Thermoplasmata archaeon]